MGAARRSQVVLPGHCHDVDLYVLAVNLRSPFFQKGKLVSTILIYTVRNFVDQMI
jgi:hypothetical protein